MELDHFHLLADGDDILLGCKWNMTTALQLILDIWS